MARTLSAVTLSAPAAPVTQGSGSTFTFTCTPTFSGTAGVNAYDLKFLVNPAGAGFVTITTGTGLSSSATNPVVGTTSTGTTSITVTCTNQDSYTIEIQGAPTSGGSFTLTSGTQTVTVLMPNAQTDWPLPAPKRPPTEVINQGILPIAVSAPIPVIFDLPARRRSAVQDIPQQFLPLNDAATPAPFSQTDWSLPSARKRVDGLPQQFLPLNDPPPFRQSDWPLPIPRKQLPSLPQQFLPLGDPGIQPFNQQDWPLQLKAKKPDELINQGILPDAQTVLVPNSLIGTVFDKPAKPRQPPTALPQQFLPLNDAAIVQPFNQQDWPLPRRPKRPDEYIKQGIPDLLNFDTTTVQRAASIVDTHAPEWRDISFVQRGIVLDIIPAPFNQTDWPTPKRARGFDELINQGILPDTPAVVVDTHSQFFWPLPAPPPKSYSYYHQSAVLAYPPPPPPTQTPDRYVIRSRRRLRR